MVGPCAFLASHIVESYPSGHGDCNAMVEGCNLGVDIGKECCRGPSTNFHNVLGTIAVQFEGHGPRST
eukprot:scaffold48105_cov30-Attheya_sp.AAC.6